MPNQTTIQNANAIFPFDGFQILIGTTEASLVNIGACDGDAVAELAWTKFKQESANAGTIIDQIKQMKANISFTMFELDTARLTEIGGGVFTKVTVAATPVSVAGEALGTGWTVGQPIKLANKMGDNTTVTSIVIDAAGLPLIVTTDYTSYVADGTNGTLGYTYIVPVTAQAGVLDADYDYTPNASNTLYAGTSTVTLTPSVVKFQHINAAGKERSLTMFAAALGDAGFSFTFGSAENDGVQSFPISLEGDLDVTRTDGRQLLAYLDEQSV